MSRKLAQLPPGEPRYVKISQDRGYGDDEHEVLAVKGHGLHREYSLRNLRTNEHLSMFTVHTYRTRELMKRAIVEKRERAQQIGRP